MRAITWAGKPSLANLEAGRSQWELCEIFINRRPSWTRLETLWSALVLSSSLWLTLVHSAMRSLTQVVDTTFHYLVISFITTTPFVAVLS